MGQCVWAAGQEDYCEMSPETGSAQVRKGLACRAEGSFLTAVGNQCGFQQESWSSD